MGPRSFERRSSKWTDDGSWGHCGSRRNHLWRRNERAWRRRNERFFPGMTIMGGMQPQAPGMCFEMNPPSAMEIPATISVQQHHEKNDCSSECPHGSIVFC
mmetsp:Transcript_13931/g.28449  ORF Transcript_13931/g.28449 Transcript_13931/m.28449 type:complete len:101 (-) Transcript_13931:121-423(-)